MRQNPLSAHRVDATLRGAALLLLAAALLLGSPLAAASFPQIVDYQGEALTAAGAPLEGVHGMTFRYFDRAGEELFVETMSAVQVQAGRFEVKLGSGETASGEYSTMESMFAAHPEVLLEVAVGDTVYAPRLSILPAGHSMKSRLVAAGVRGDDDNDPHWKHYNVPGGATTVQSGILQPQGSEPRDRNVEGAVWSRPYTLPVVGPYLSRPVRDLPEAVQKPFTAKTNEVNALRHETLYDADGNRFGTQAPKTEDYLAGQQSPHIATPSVQFTFEGVGNVSGVLPPDTEGTVGPNHYVHVVNSAFQVFDKTGTALTSVANTNTLWAGFGGPCQTNNSGDAIFLYDEQADRYVLTQFAVASGNQSVCWAVSQTGDPTGAYYLYEVVTPRFPDYYKVGVWPAANNNAYFFTTNSGFQGQYDVFAVDRANMLAGNTARPMQFFQNFVNLLMPADLDGSTGPAASQPGLFYTFRDGGESYFGSPPTDSIDLYEFDVDWNTPANSTMTLIKSFTPAADGLAPFNWTVCGFFVSNCLPQPGTSQGIDSASWWPMQRLVYRNFGSHETLLGSWTVDVNATGNRAAPRWFELRNVGSGWTIHQQGTHSPDAIHRWMPSIAMDGSGNIALGYSRGDGSNFASIYYTVQETTDPLGTMQAEAVLFTGTGAQTSSAARWGDYSSMELDPADDCTFWYTNQYLSTTGSAPWRTRIGVFKIPSCGGPANNPPTVTITAPADGSTFDVGTSVSFSGTATDPEDGTITGSLTWTSSIDGSIGSGGSFSTSSLSLGNHLITASVTDSGGSTRTDTVNITIRDPNSNGPQNAAYDAGLGAPACAIAGSSCDSTTLLEGRGTLGPEQNQPNTLDGCADGTAGTYLSDESIERIVISSTSGDFTEGGTAQIDVTVFAWNTGTADTLDLYYTGNANSPTWTYITSIVPPAGGTQTLSASYTLPAGALQAVRANFRYQGSVSSCSPGTFDDHDDLVFAVNSAGGNTAPTVNITAPANGSTFTVGTSVSFSGTANDTEDGDISGSLGWTSSINGSIGSGASFSTSSLSVGTHTITASATDSGGLSDSDSISVTINSAPNTPPTVNITAPANGSSFNDGDSVTFSGTATDAEDGNIAANLSWTSSLDGAIGSGASFSTTSLSVGSHTITASVTDSGGASDSDSISITINAVGGGDTEIWMSFRSNTAVPGVGTVTDEDIVSYNETTGVWALEFDGSDVGLGGLEISGFERLPGGDFLLSFTAAGTVGGLAVDDSDVVRFAPTSLGANTAGSFSVYFDGSDVGLTSNGEDIDAIALTAAGELVISTLGSISANGASGADEDLWIFTGTTGPATSGSFTRLFDGSDVGLSTSSSEDVDAATLTAGGNLLISTVGNFAVTGASGADEDIAEFSGTYGNTTSGTFTLRQDLSALGIDPSEDIGGIQIFEN